MEFLKTKKKELETILIGIITMLFSVLIIIWLTNLTKNSDNSNLQNDKKDRITLWYSDENYCDYFTQMATEYEKQTGIKVYVEYVSSIDFLEKINDANNSVDYEKEIPDLYLYDCENLESAYGCGLANENKDDKTYSEKNYSKVAIDAVTYNNKIVAYPFTYDTAFLVYNTDYVSKAPETFDEITEFSKTFNRENNKNVTNIILWDISDVFLNYGFIGNYFNIGGQNGDDHSKLDIKNDNIIKSLNYYKSFLQNFKITIDDIKGISEKEMFASGSLVFTIQNCKGLSKIEEYSKDKNVSYDICNYPSLTKDLNSKSLSKTTSLVVNYLSDNKENACEFAKFLTYDNADKIYDYIGLMPARKCNFDNELLMKIQDQYNKSVSLPKLMVTNDLFIQIQIMINKVLEGEDIPTSLSSLYEIYNIRMKK